MVYFASEGGKLPFWGQATAATNFCEEDYHLTPYIAEFVNSLTNAGYVYYAILGLRNNWGRRPFADFNLQYFALLFVGIGSASFHMTLKRAGQSADQISMFLAAAAVLHRVIVFNNAPYKTPLALALGLILALVFWTQLVLDRPVIHWVVFASMLAVIWRRVIFLIERNIKDKRMVIKTRGMALSGFAAFAIGYGFWVVDVSYCTELRVLRRYLGLPSAWLLEFHGWWHLFTGAGAYLYMALAEYLHLASIDGDGRKDITIEKAWPALFNTVTINTS
ncbi:hypothetical protein AJ79_01571 [Helicocarpus griseus UAMH5409]|uniref:Alkaline phytoceramidase n=1 Tax=Helicocarpus griseus UAMH5409 TaxID=1447875 RepID=A0A2B7Y723_9EURO|nr:hypothetical protein AJ79_01571 [Helicocarpus griseus UAMH5409]